MSENTDKQVRCVICNSGGPDLLIPYNPETKTELESLLGIYCHFIHKVRGVSANFLNDAMYRDAPIFYSFCHLCLPQVRHLLQLNCQTEKQILLIRHIPLMESNDGNISVSHQNEQQQPPQATPSTSQVHFVENEVEPKRMKMSDDKVCHQSESQLIFSTSADTEICGISTTSFGDMVDEEEDVEDDEVVVVQNQNLNVVQNPDVQMVSIGSSDDDEEEEDEPEIIVKQLDVSTYVFLYKDECLCFKRSDSFLKFDYGTCLTQVQNITNVINHVWTDHCDNGKVKVLPNYRIDAYEANGGGGSSSHASSSTAADTNERNSVVIGNDHSRVLYTLPDGRVYYNPDLPFVDVGDGTFRCSWCFRTGQDIVSHTNSCLRKKNAYPHSSSTSI